MDILIHKIQLPVPLSSPLYRTFEQAYNGRMQNAAQYFTRFNSARGRFGTLPSLARFILSIFALPGIVLLLLSVVTFVCSIFILLLLTVPVYGALQAVFGSVSPPSGGGGPENSFAFSFFGSPTQGTEGSPYAKHVEAKVTDAE